jgi:hypothetical protein
VVLSANERNYERFAPQKPGGRAAPERGIREFVVGTGGGKGYYPSRTTERRNSSYSYAKATLSSRAKPARLTNSSTYGCHTVGGR